jgi:hypothetical protein
MDEGSCFLLLGYPLLLAVFLAHATDDRLQTDSKLLDSKSFEAARFRVKRQKDGLRCMICLSSTEAGNMLNALNVTMNLLGIHGDGLH